jgi:hypothetical protein
VPLQGGTMYWYPNTAAQYQCQMGGQASEYASRATHRGPPKWGTVSGNIIK